jgi:hypothetical protein
MAEPDGWLFEEDSLVLPLVDISGQILSGCIDMSTIIAARGIVVKCLWENSWELFGGV